MTSIGITLLERAGQMYRRLLILQRLFQPPREGDDVEWFRTGDASRDLALCAGIRDMLDELTEHAKVLTSIPLPLSEWRPGDGPDDERWRGLTDMERRDVLSMVSSYENLISWAEGMMLRDLVASREPCVEGATVQSRTGVTCEPHVVEYLNGERERVARFRHDLRVLEKRITR